MHLLHLLLGLSPEHLLLAVLLLLHCFSNLAWHQPATATAALVAACNLTVYCPSLKTQHEYPEQSFDAQTSAW